MKRLVLFATVLIGCASTPSYDTSHSAVLAHPINEVREAARVVVEEIAHPGGIGATEIVVRASDERVITEGRIGICGRDVACGSSSQTTYPNTATPQTTIEVFLQERGQDTAIQVEIEYLSADQCATCAPVPLASTGFLEHQIIEGIRARLEDA